MKCLYCGDVARDFGLCFDCGWIMDRAEPNKEQPARTAWRQTALECQSYVLGFAIVNREDIHELDELGRPKVRKTYSARIDLMLELEDG
jgi:hypothetical protein